MPAGHVDEGESAGTGGAGPRLGPVGWLRFAWRQLTSMRTAIILLLLLAIASVPGSLVPQTTSDPNGVVAWKANDPEAAAVLDALGLFSVFTSPWFSAIYLLLFVSLIGCVIPRTVQHAKAIVAAPPKVPVRLQRLAGYTTRSFAGTAEQAATAAAAALRRRGYRVRLAGDGRSVSAERGYLRETGNLLFHVSMIGVLIGVGLGGGFGYNGQRVVAEGMTFTNVLTSYDSFYPGRFFSDSALAPFSVRLDDLEVEYETGNVDALGAPLDFIASVTITHQDGTEETATLKVNEPLVVDGVRLFLLGNGYAPVLTIRDADGVAVFSQPTLFRPLDSMLTSLGIVKIPDGLDEQVGIQALLYPSSVTLESGALASSFPDLVNPVVTLEVYTGDLGLDDGQATNAYTLDTESLTLQAGRDADEPTILLTPGTTADLPDGLGTVELTSVPRFIALEVRSDPAGGWVLGFAMLALGSLLVSLFIPRRRVWARALDRDGATTLEWAGLARGEDPRVEEAVRDLADAAAADSSGEDSADTEPGRSNAP